MSSAYERFIAANETLTKCWESVDVAKFQQMNAGTQAVQCRAEREAVADILRSGEVSFRSLLDARISALKAQQGAQL